MTSDMFAVHDTQGINYYYEELLFTFCKNLFDGLKNIEP